MVTGLWMQKTLKSASAAIEAALAPFAPTASWMMARSAQLMHTELTAAVARKMACFPRINRPVAMVWGFVREDSACFQTHAMMHLLRGNRSTTSEMCAA